MKEAKTDICKSKSKSINSFEITIGKIPDPAGGPKLDDTKEIDLCLKCLQISFNKLINNMPMKDRDKVLEYLIKKIPLKRPIK